MSVSAKIAKVSALLDTAILYRQFRNQRSRPLDAADEASIEKISTALELASGDQIVVDQRDLTTIHRLSNLMDRANPSRLRVSFQTHCMACYLAVAIPWLFTAPAIIITAPLVVPYYCLTVPIFGGHPIYSWLAFHLGIRYALLIVPSYYIARDLRFRELTPWAYLVTGVVLIGWPLYFYLA